MSVNKNLTDVARTDHAAAARVRVSVEEASGIGRGNAEFQELFAVVPEVPGEVDLAGDQLAEAVRGLRRYALRRVATG